MSLPERTSRWSLRELLGHANIQQTANTYMHGDQAVTADWMQRYEQAIRASVPQINQPAN